MTLCGGGDLTARVQAFHAKPYSKGTAIDRFSPAELPRRSLDTALSGSGPPGAGDTARAMSQENVEIVRDAFEVIYGWAGRPTATGASIGQDRERAAELIDSNVEMHGTVGGLWEGRVARGLPEILDSFMADDLEAWEERRLDPQGFLHINDLVVVLMHEYRRGKGSGIEMESDTAVVFTVRQGRVIRVQGYLDQATALEAAGLSE